MGGAQDGFGSPRWPNIDLGGQEDWSRGTQERFPAPTGLFSLVLELPHGKPPLGNKGLHLGKVMTVLFPGLRKIQELLPSENCLPGNRASNFMLC